MLKRTDKDGKGEFQETKADKGSSRFAWIRWCIFLSGLSVFAQLYLFQPILPGVASSFHTSIGDISFLVSSSTIGMALGLFYFTFNADNYSRKNIMVFALISSAILTIISAYVNDLPVLVTIGVVKGFVISGVSAVALAYIAEEVSLSIVGFAISFYLAGNIIGGMSGRILAALLAGFWGWQNAVLIIGIESLLLGLVFWRYFPESRFFTPQKRDYKIKIKRMKTFIRDPYLLSLYGIAALLMGVFVSVYNYLSFRLEAPPFELDHVFVAFIFLMYIFGVVGTMLTNRLTQRFSEVQVLKGGILGMGIGLALLLLKSVTVVVMGLGLVTLTFFAVHTVASRMVAGYKREGKSSATSIYWLFYYLGSSILGSATGYLLHGTSWSIFIGILLAALVTGFFFVSRIGKIKRLRG